MMNRYRFRTKEEMKQSWKEMKEVAPTVRSYHIGEWLLYSGILSVTVMVLGLLFKIHIALGTIVMAGILVAPVVKFFINGVKRWKK